MSLLSNNNDYIIGFALWTIIHFSCFLIYCWHPPSQMKRVALHRMCSCKDLKSQAAANTSESSDAVCTYQDVSQGRGSFVGKLSCGSLNTQVFHPKYTGFSPYPFLHNASKGHSKCTGYQTQENQIIFTSNLCKTMQRTREKVLNIILYHHWTMEIPKASTYKKQILKNNNNNDNTLLLCGNLFSTMNTTFHSQPCLSHWKRKQTNGTN